MEFSFSVPAGEEGGVEFSTCLCVLVVKICFVYFSPADLAQYKRYTKNLLIIQLEETFISSSVWLSACAHQHNFIALLTVPLPSPHVFYIITFSIFCIPVLRQI